ncbi:co-chaperone GroES [Candidatus Woesearchaeota archaeon]|nr:MAG: co-chaperone GroES [Candidatus Woesearchaeota archaeon]
MKFKPLGERVLLKPEKEEEKTKGGIYIPDTAKEKKKQGEVLAVGTYTKGPNAGKPLPLSKGDKVLYGGYSADEIEVDGEEFVFVDFKDVLAKIE